MAATLVTTTIALITTLAAAFERQTGIKDAAGLTMRQIEPRHEEHWFSILGNVARTRTPLHFEQKAEYLIDGWYELFAFPVENGNNSRVGVLFYNITQRKKAETALRESDERKTFLLRLADALRPMTHPLHIQRTVTSIAMHHFGTDRCYYCEVESNNAIIRYDARKQGLPSVAGTYPLTGMPVFKAVIDAGRTFIVHDVHTSPIVDESLRELCISLQVISFIDVPVIKNGVLAGILCIVHGTPRQWTDFDVELAEEVAERTWAAVEREKEEREKEELLRHKEEFISIASHELKTPLTSIKSYTELLQDMLQMDGNDMSIELTGKLNAQVDRLTELIHALLDTTRIAEGKLVLQPRLVDLNKLIRQRVEELQHLTNRHRLIVIPGALPPVHADSERIGQVLTNLITNAIKYSPGGGGIVIITTAGEKEIKVSVRDQGIGISPLMQEKIFERFFRITHARVQRSDGMGLGLYISAGIIARHGGTLTVDSKEGEGSEFTFTLPL